ncbi:hypothetical protein [Stenotrophomonas sp. MYb238]|nr:hypothetical protein [Stenotrophomonas sp. MYb238]
MRESAANRAGWLIAGIPGYRARTIRWRNDMGLISLVWGIAALL